MTAVSREARFTTLFDATYQALLGYAVRRVADPADAADVVAETYLVAWRRLDDVPAGAQARPWLFGVARNVLANYYRGERRRTVLALRLRETLATDVAESAVESTAIGQAMARLGGDDRELLRLVAWEGLARDEIAMVLRVSRATVRVRLHRARRRLIALMAELDGVEDEPSQAGRGRAAGLRHVTSGRAAGLPGPEEV